MQLKDYYTILQLPPSASLEDVKKAYRRLAQLYHPDKTGNDLYAAVQFAEIKEAYETLINPAKKELYLQQRWYAQSTGQRRKQQAQTPTNILKQLLELDKYVSRLDVHRLDKEGLNDYLHSIFTAEAIEVLNTFNEEEVNKAIIHAALRSSKPLSYNDIKILSEKLLHIKTEEPVVQMIYQQIGYAKQVAQWNKYKPWLFLLIAILLCSLVFLLSR